MQFHDVELAAEARREVAARIAIYDKWVIEGRLTRELAERRIAMMRAIAERLEMGAPMLQSAAAHMAEKPNEINGKRRNCGEFRVGVFP